MTDGDKVWKIVGTHTARPISTGPDSSPAALIAPGERTGKYRTGTDRLVTNAQRESRISVEDYAVAMIDGLEQPQHIRRRFTVAY